MADKSRFASETLVRGVETVGTPVAIGTITVGGTTYTKYRKVVDFGNFPNNTSKDVSLGLSTSNKLLSATVTGNSPSGSIVLPIISGTGGDSSYNIEMTLVSNAMRVTTHRDRSAFTGLVTIEYY